MAGSTRTVNVRLVADVSQYVSSLTRAGAATSGLTGTLTRGFSGAGVGALALGGAVTAGLGMAISKSMDFEKAMSAVSAATGQGAAALGDLRQAAMEAGADTQYSATEAANAITEMAKAGVSTADIMGGGLKGALALAAAGQLDVAEAAGVASIAMTQFKLSGEDLPHVADLLAAGAGKAMGSVHDLGMALNQAGLVASSAGLSIEETTGTLAAFASAGLIGSDAGTSLKTMLQRLQNPSQEAASVMSDLGISMYDSNGQFVGMSNLAGQLQRGMAGLTPAVRDAAMATIFGSDAVRAANVLYSEGSQGITEWTAAVDDAGYAQKQAAALTDNLSGDIERLGGAFDTLLINLGSGAQGPLRGLVQMLTGLIGVVGTVITWFSNLPGPVLAGVGALTALMVINGPLAGAIGRSALALAAWYGSAVAAAGGAGIASVAMTGLRGAMASTMTLMGGPLGLALVGVTVGLGFLVSAFTDTEGATEANVAAQTDLQQALSASKGAIDDNVRAAAAKAAADQHLLELAQLMGIDGSLVTDAILGQGTAYDDVRLRVQAFGNQAEYLRQGMGTTRMSTDEFNDALAQLRGQVVGGTQDAVLLAQATAETNTVIAGTGPALGLAGDALEEWSKDVATTLGSFVDPVGVYKDLVQQVAQSTADSTDSSKDSWSDYADSTTVSLGEVATQLQEQVTAQENWRTNIVLATQRGGIEVGQALAAMGEDGAGLVQQMVNANDADFQRLAGLMVQQTHLGGQGAADALNRDMQVMAAIGAAGAYATVQGIAAQLQLGADVVRGIAAQYGANLAEGVNPLIQALGQPAIRYSVPAAAFGFPGYADGGFTGFGGKYEPAGVVHRGEYVLTKDETARLGVDRIEAFANQGYANGGFVGTGDVPRPRSTAPYGPPISSAGDATMRKEYDAVTAWIDKNALSSMGGVLGMGAVGGGWQSIAKWVQSRIPQARINSTYRPGDPGYHGAGKAVDFGFGGVPGGNGSAGLALIKRTLYEGIGGTLAELIYDGVPSAGVPDLKNSKPHSYNAATQAEHHNHVHAATYDQGGWLRPGYTMAYNGTGQNERVLTGREWSGGGAARGGPGIDYGRLAKAIASAERSQLHITTSDNPAAIIRAQAAYEQQREALAPAW